MTDLVKPNHKIIYLVPDDVDSWLWCDDPAPAPSMVEDEAIKYIRADQVDKEIEQLKKDKAELIEALKDAGKDIVIAGEFLHEHDTIEKGRKYLAIASKHTKED